MAHSLYGRHVIGGFWTFSELLRNWKILKFKEIHARPRTKCLCCPTDGNQEEISNIQSSLSKKQVTYQEHFNLAPPTLLHLYFPDHAVKHSRPQRPDSSWSASRVTTSGWTRFSEHAQRHWKSTIHLTISNVTYCCMPFKMRGKTDQNSNCSGSSKGG